MHTLTTQIPIDASAERVWSLLVDFPRYPSWNPFVRSIEGHPQVGTTLKIFIQPAGAKGMGFKPIVLAVDELRELRWKGKLLLPGLLDGEHYFKIASRPDGGIQFEQGELFSGILVPLFKKSLDGATKNGFDAMNVALKRAAEAAG